MTDRCALLVVDMQNDFCQEGKPLFVAGAPAIFDAVRESVDVARAKGVPVIWVVREHHPSGERAWSGVFSSWSLERER
jgi:nicotinamidase-related amidase